MPQVGVRHRRVLTLNVHAAHRTGVNRIHHFDDGQAGLVGNPHAPQRLEVLTRGRAGHALVVRQHHRDQARVRCALHVVLSTQRMQAGARAANLPGGHRQRDQAARVVGAVHMLADAHAPENHRRFRRRIGTRHGADRCRINAANFRHPLGRRLGHRRFQRIKAVNPRGDEVRIGQAFEQDDVQHAVEQRHVGIRPELQMPLGEACQRCLARIGEQQLGAALDRVLDPARGDRVIGTRVGTNQKDQFRMRHILHRIADRAGANALQQRRDRARVAKPRAMIDVVAAKALANQLLEEIGLFVAALRRAKARQRGRRPGCDAVSQRAQAGRGHVKRFVPACLTEQRREGQFATLDAFNVGRVFAYAFAANERHGEPFAMLHVVKPVAALDAQAAMIGRAIATGDEFDSLRPGRISAHVISELTAHAAVGAHRVHLELDGTLACACRGHQRPGRASLHALTTGHAG